MKRTTKKAKPTAAETSVPDWREVELNERPPVVAANRVAVYTGPTGVTVRFLHTLALERDRLTAGTMDVLQLTNVATLELHPAVAKRLIVDLTAGLSAHEAAYGEVQEIEQLGLTWSQRPRSVN